MARSADLPAVAAAPMTLQSPDPDAIGAGAMAAGALGVATGIPSDRCAIGETDRRRQEHPSKPLPRGSQWTADPAGSSFGACPCLYGHVRPFACASNSDRNFFT